MDALTEREKGVILLRFGLHDGYSRTLEEIGKRFGVGRERIRQIESKAIRKMKRSSKFEALENALMVLSSNDKLTQPRHE